MRLTICNLLGASVCALALGGTTANAAAPAKPQGYITFRTYAGDQRAGIRAGTASADGVFYPKRAEGPYNGYPGDDLGDDDTNPVNIRENYNMELIGYFYPPKTGKVQFAVCTDDPGELWVSTDDNPANKVQVASETNWNPIRAFAGGDPTAPTRRTLVTTGDPNPRPQNWSPYMSVVAGKPYFIQSIGTEFGGGDNNAIAFRYSTDPEFQDGDKPISGQYLSTYDRPDIGKAVAVSVEASPTGFAINIVNGTGAAGTKLNASTVKVQLDGADVTTTVAASASGSKISYAHTGIFAAGSTHKAKLAAKDSAGSDITLEQNFTVLNYALLGKDLRIPDTAVDKSKPGFRWRVFQGANTENSNARTELSLSGQLKDGAGAPLPNLADPSAQGNAVGPGKKLGTADNALIEFAIPTVVNWDQSGGSNGAFQPDEQMPGIPGVEGGTDGIAGEVFAYIELPKGLIQMGVNSDDGFKTTGGLNPADAASAIVLGEFNGGRGASDTIFTFVVEEAGFYALRTTWEEGGGGANIEWFTLKADGTTKVLVNDTANGGVKAYRVANVQTPAALVARVPAPGATQVARKPKITAAWSDPGAVIVQASIKMKVDGKDVTVKISKSGDTLSADYDVPTDFGFDQTVKVDLTYNNAGRDSAASWSFFTLIDLGKPGTLFIETEDFDYDGGKYITNKPIGMTGKYPGGAYKDLGDGLANPAGNKSFGVDYFEADPGSAQAIYRPETGVEAGKETSAAAGPITGGLNRGTFDVEINYNVGWDDAGDWCNYTRDFPTPAKNYSVFGRLSSGGSAIHMDLSQVASGVGTKTQTLKKLGEFRPGRATAGWDGAGAFETFPLINDDGSRAIVTLGGKTTLRLTTIDGNNDNDFLIFQEAAAVVPSVGGKFTGIKVEANNVVIQFTGSGVQSADSVAGPWTDVPGSSPLTVPKGPIPKFYKFKP